MDLVLKISWSASGNVPSDIPEEKSMTRYWRLISTLMCLVQVAIFAPALASPRSGTTVPTGQPAIPPKFLWAGNFRNGVAPVTLADHRMGFIDHSGTAHIKDSYWIELGNFSEGLAKAVMAHSVDSTGYVDGNGRWAINANFANGKDFHEGLAAVQFQCCSEWPLPEEPWGYINTAGTEVITGQFLAASSFSSGHAAVRVSNGVWGLIDKNGSWTIPPQFHQLKGVGKNLYAAQSGLYGYKLLDQFGHQIGNTQFQEIGTYSSGLAPVQIDDQYWSFINQKGKKVFPKIRANRVSSFHNGLAAVQINKKWGYINLAAKMVIKTQFDGAESFSSSAALVKSDGKYWFIDVKGKRRSKTYSAAQSYSEGLAAVKVGKLWGFIR